MRAARPRVCLRRGPGVARARGDRPRPLTSAPMNERILVVDDTPANIQTVAAILKGKGYQLSVATNGKQALDALTKIRPDLILLDVMMPELDGFETCQRIKSSEAWRDIPIIFLTAKTDTADIVKGFEMGAVDYVGTVQRPRAAGPREHAPDRRSAPPQPRAEERGAG